MKNYKILALIIVLLVTVGFKACDKDEDVWNGGYSTKHKTRTPKGAYVVSRQEPNAALFPSIDRGLDNAFRIAQQYGYTQALHHDFYTVALFKRSPKCINPGFLVAADGSDWDGTEYDKDPRDFYVRLCAAGLTPNASAMVVADDPGHMFNIVWFEAEHLILRHNDYAKWYSTIGVHSHPILPDTAEKEFEVQGFNGKTVMTVLTEDIGELKKGDRICIVLVQ